MKTLPAEKKGIIRGQKKRVQRNQRSRAKKKQRTIEKQSRQNLVFRLRKTMVHYFPDLFDRIGRIRDYRQAPEYELVELIVAGVALFLFKEGSRNAMNNDREEGEFQKNYRRLFTLRLPHMDTVDQVLRQLAEDELEKLKKEMIQGLLEKKVLAKHRLLGKYYRVMKGSVCRWGPSGSRIQTEILTNKTVSRRRLADWRPG